MRAFRSLGQSALVYIVVSFLLCGGPFSPILLLTLDSDLLGAPFWTHLVIVGGVIAAGGSLAAGRTFGTHRYWLPMFVGLWMVLSFALVGIYATHLRAMKVAAFHPDDYVASTFIRSLHNTPADFQFFLHAAAIKDCKPYAWSYRTMAFYELPSGIAVDLYAFPREWVDRCAIRRPD